MVEKLKRILEREMFIPSLLGVIINPFYIIRRGLLNGIVTHAKYMTGTLLDFGCGKKPYKELFTVDDYIGVDIETSGHSHRNENIDEYYDGMHIPFDDNHFDSVFSSEVFEHVFNLDEIVSEIHRVIKPSGYLLITVPFVWDEHEVPYDCARYTSFGITHVLNKAGFDVVQLEKTTNYIETIFQMLAAYVNQYILPSNKYFRIMLNPVCIMPITLLGLTFSKLLPESRSFYHNNIVVAKKRMCNVV